MFTTRRTAKIALVATAVAGTVTMAAPGAQAATSDTTNDTIWNLGYDTSATTTIKKSGQSSTTTGFTFSTLHVEKGDLSSDIMLKDFKMPVKLGKLQIAIATISQEPVGKAVGTIDPNTHKIVQTQKVNLHIKDVSATGKGLINLVGKNCRTSSPITMTVTGKQGGLFDPINLSGTFTIPNFTNCGLSTSLVNSQVAGPGNTINMTLTPHG